jgi:hypothetical protein
MNKIEHVNRGWLKRQVAKGLILARCNYHYTDDYLGDAANNFDKTGWMEARMRSGYEDFKEGLINFWESDFSTKSGTAYREDGNMVSFIVHSNLSYSLKFKDDKNIPGKWSKA